MSDSLRKAYKHNSGQSLTTDAKNVDVDRAFIAHYHIDAADAVAESSDGVFPATSLLATVQDKITGITNPAVPRNLRIDGNVSGITGNVIATGTNFAGDEITETIQANGITAVDGNLAFKEITKLRLPVRNHTPVLQVETATAAGTVTTSGNASVTVKSALFEEDEAVAVPVVEDDDAAAIALAIRTALAANANISEHFTVSGETAAVILTAKIAAANDATLNIAIADGTGDGASVGVTTAASSANTTAGVATDTISVGWGKKFGIPYMLTADELAIVKLFNNAADTGTVTPDDNELEKNVIALTGTPDGLKPIDLYLIV